MYRNYMSVLARLVVIGQNLKNSSFRMMRNLGRDPQDHEESSADLSAYRMEAGLSISAAETRVEREKRENRGGEGGEGRVI